MILLAVAWIFVSGVSGPAQSQQADDPYFPIWDEKGKEGYIDSRGKTVITPRFEKVTEFTEGLAAVRVAEKWGYIDRTGTVVIAPRWKEVYPFSDGVAAVVDGVHGYAYTPLPEEGDPYEISLKACGYIDKSGRYVIEASLERKMTQCSPFVEGLAPVCFDPTLKIFFPEFANAGLCGYLNKSGEWVIEPKFHGATQFNDGLALVRSGRYHDKTSNQWLSDFAFIDKAGKSVLELKGYLDAHSFREGLAQVSKRVGRVSFIDRTGRSRIELNATNVGDFNNGSAVAQDPVTNLYGYIGQEGKWVIPPKYKQADSFSEGLAFVCTEPSQCAYINPEGKVITQGRGERFGQGLSRQYLYTRTIGPRPDFRNIYGYMNKAGKYVWVSPGGELFLGQKWWRENYIGPNMPTSFKRP